MHRSRWMPSLVALLLGLALAFALFSPLRSGDLGWHIRVGQYWLEYGAVPRLNFLTYTAAWHPWLTHEWLSGVMFALLDRVGGVPLLFGARGLLFVAPLLLLLGLGRRLGAESFGLAGLLWLLTITLALNVALRPWLFSNLLVAFFLLQAHHLRSGQQTRARLWACIPLLGLWINLHGEFAVGTAFFGLLLLEWVLRQPSPLESPASTRLERLGTAALLSVALLGVLLLNPHGVDALVLPLLYVLGDAASGVALRGELKEWAPIALDSFFGAVYLLWIGLLLLALWRMPRLRARPETWLALVFIYLTFQSQRHLPLVALFCAPVVMEGVLAPLAAWLDEARSVRSRFWRGLSWQEGDARPAFTAVLFGLLLLGFAISSYDPNPSEQQRLMQRQMQRYPLEAVHRLNTLPPGRLFNHYDWSGLIAWKAPAWPLFITPANDAYPRRLFEDWLEIANLGSSWAQTLARYGVDTVLMPTGSSLVQTLGRQPGWRVEYADGQATLLRLDLEKLELDLHSR